MKKVLSFVLAVVIVIVQLPPYAKAEEARAEAQTVSISISNGSESATYEVLAQNSDLYFPAELFGEVTNYEYSYSEKNQKVSYQLGKKVIIIDLATGGMQIPALNYTGTVDVISNENGNYISASALLPWLNVGCSVTETGTLEIIPDGVSLWEILDEVKTDYKTYLFNLYEEYGDSATSVAGLIAMGLFDTIINLRWDRLIPADGTVSGAAKSNSYYDYKCYIAALTDFATDDVFTSDTAKKRVDTAIKVNKGLGDLEAHLGIDEEKIQRDVDSYLYSLGTDSETVTFFYDVTETWQGLRQGISDYEQVSKYLDVFSVLKALELSLKTDNEYRAYINWLSDQDTGNGVFDSALERTVLKLSENEGAVISLYIDFAEKILSQLPDNLFDAIVNNSSNHDFISAASAFSEFKANFFGGLDEYMMIARAVFGKILGITDGYEEMSKIAVNETIGDYCWQLQEKLQVDEMTADNVAHIRQSVATALKASKLCYQAMQSTMDSRLLKIISGTDNSTLMNYKIDPINEQLTDLLASADNTENDSIEGKEEYQAKILKQFKDVKIGSSGIEYISTDIYNDFLQLQFQYKYYVIIDIDGNGVPELLAAKELSDIGGTMYPTEYNLVQEADIYTLIEGKASYLGSVGTPFTNLSFCLDSRKLCSGWGGSGVSQQLFYYVDQNTQLITESVTYDSDSDEYSQKMYAENGDCLFDSSINEAEFNSIIEFNSNIEYLNFNSIVRSSAADVDWAHNTISAYGTESWYDSDYEYSVLNFSLIPTTFENCGDYYLIYAEVGEPILVPEDLHIGISFSFVSEGKEYVVTQTEDGLIDQNGVLYDCLLSTTPILCHSDNSEVVYADLACCALRIRPDAITGTLVLQQFNTVTPAALSNYEIDRFKKLEFDKDGYVIGLYDILS